MPGWKHFTRWNEIAWHSYRKYVAVNAPGLIGSKEDCADLSMFLLIDFARQNGLPVTLEDNDKNRYSSQDDQAIYFAPGYPTDLHIANWEDSWEKFYDIVKQRIGAKALFRRNTVWNPAGPAPGDLLLNETHCALVFRVYPPGARHPHADNSKIPNFPGDLTAKEQFHTQEYFLGTTTPYFGVTQHRNADTDFHFDYLNSRSNSKRNAELIYFANARQALQAGFVFCQYSAGVLGS